MDSPEENVELRGHGPIVARWRAVQHGGPEQTRQFLGDALYHVIKCLLPAHAVTSVFASHPQLSLSTMPVHSMFLFRCYGVVLLSVSYGIGKAHGDGSVLSPSAYSSTC